MAFSNNELFQSVIGALLKQPSIIHSFEGTLSLEDFRDRTDIGIQSQIFLLVINQLIERGTANGEVALNNIGEIFKEFPEWKGKFGGSDQKIANFYQICCENADLSNFNGKCHYLKKLSLLRDLKEHGYDVSRYDYEAKPFESGIEQRQAIDSDDEAAILGYVEKRFSEVKSRHISGTSGSIKAGEGIRELIASFQQAPDIGPELNGLYYNSIVGGARRGAMYLRSGGTNVGKALPNDTKIPMFNGTWKFVKDVIVGDQLIGSNGRATTVLAIHPQKEQKEIYRITFGDGHEVLCCKDHLWGVYTGKKIHYEVLSTEQLMARPMGSCGVPLVKPIEYSEKVLPLNPYTMGAILGSGSFCFSERKKAFEFYAPSEEFPAYVAKLSGWLYKVVSSEPTKYRFYHEKGTCSHSLVWVEDILAAFPELWNKKIHEKFIPEVYLYGSVKQREELLMGLLDAAATVSKTGAISYATTSEKLSKQLEQLARSLGLMVVVSSPKPKEGARRKYKLTFRFPTGYQQDYFRMSYKKEQVAQSSQAIIKYYNFAWITKIEATGTYCDMTCFTVDAKDALFCMDNYTLTHNTRWAVFDACKIAFPFYYSNEVKDWVYCRDKQPGRVLFITTEMKAKEIQSILLAYISGIDEQYIRRNALSPNEQKRLEQAAQVLETYQDYFILEAIEDPNLTNVQNTIKKHILLNDVGYVFYDYIFTSPSLIQQFSSSGIREDVALALLANQLKEIAATHNVFVATSTQLNGDGLKFGEKRDQRALRGSKAIADKADMACLIARVGSEDLEQIQEYTKEFGVPTHVTDIYKVRQGSFKGTRIWSKLDLGTGTKKDLFITDENNKLYLIEEYMLYKVSEEKRVYNFQVELENAKERLAAEQ